MSGALDRFLPVADVRERRQTLVHAPAALVLEVAEQLPLQSIPAVRVIFWLRSRIMGARYVRSEQAWWKTCWRSAGQGSPTPPDVNW